MKKAVEYLGNIVKTTDNGIEYYVLIKRNEPYQVINRIGITSWSFRVRHWTYQLQKEESYVKPELLEELKPLFENLNEDVVSVLYTHNTLALVISDECNLDTLQGRRKASFKLIKSDY